MGWVADSCHLLSPDTPKGHNPRQSVFSLHRQGNLIMDFNVEKLEVRKFTQIDLSAFHSLIHLFNTVFEEDESAISNQKNLLKLLSDESFIAIAAFYEDELVGGLTAYELTMYYSENSEVFVYDLAVKPEHQRKGIGKRLIHHLKEYCIKNGINEFFVLAHAEDEHAAEFYRSTGGKSEEVVNFIYKAGSGKE
jgi:aminoglycoside 3-N-acetyltransferase I